MGNLKTVGMSALLGLMVVAGSAEATVPLPVPEPATGLLLLVALGGGGVLAKRWKS
jgi:hypothetical protein